MEHIMFYGDLFMKVLYRTRPYEKVKGSANALYEKWVKICMDSLESAKFSTFSKNIKGIIRDFDNLELLDIKKPRVGLVGEMCATYALASKQTHKILILFVEYTTATWLVSLLICLYGIFTLLNASSNLLNA